MSAMGQKRTSDQLHFMSALPPKADIGTWPSYVRRNGSGSRATSAAVEAAGSGGRPWVIYNVLSPKVSRHVLLRTNDAFVQAA